MNDNRFIISNGNDNGGMEFFFTHFHLSNSSISIYVSKDYPKGLQIEWKLPVDHMFAFGFSKPLSFRCASIDFAKG